MCNREPWHRHLADGDIAGSQCHALHRWRCGVSSLRPQRGTPPLAEWEIRFYARYVCGIHKRCLTQSAFALRTLRSQQMTPRGVRSQHLAARRDFKTLRHCFTCFAPSNWLRHKTPKITQLAIQRIKDLTIDRKMSEVEGGFTRRGQIAKSLNH